MNNSMAELQSPFICISLSAEVETTPVVEKKPAPRQPQARDMAAKTVGVSASNVQRAKGFRVDVIESCR